MKGKIAVIDICYRCPYRFYETEMGMLFSKGKLVDTPFNQKILCCYYGVNRRDDWFDITDNVGLDNTILLDVPRQHPSCPLPEGDDGSLR